MLSPGVTALFLMWLILTVLSSFIYFYPTQATDNSVTQEFPKIISETWKYVTGATVAALVGKTNKKNGKETANTLSAKTPA